MDIRKNSIVALVVTIIILGGYSIARSQTVFTVVEGDVTPPQNNAPVAVGATIYADQTTTNFTLEATDVDSNPLSYSVNSSSLRYGSVVGSGSSYSYTITATDRGNELIDYLTFTAYDGNATSNTATVTINIPKVPSNIVEEVIEAVKKSRRKKSSPSRTTTVTPVVPTTPVVIPNYTPTYTPTVPVSSSGSRMLTVGSKGEDVRALQKMLNNSGFKVTLVGAGSPGNETTTFGQATRAALIKYQTAKGLAVTGTYRTSSTAVTPVVPVVTTPSVPVSTAGVSFNRDLKVGASGADVKKLQQVLNSKGYIVAPTGVGSPGNESTYMGAKTSAAVLKLQKANGLPAVGWVGPKTRAFLNSL